MGLSRNRLQLGWMTEGAWLPSLLLRTAPAVAMLPALLWALWCDAVSVYSIQRYLSSPFVNYIRHGLKQYKPAAVCV